eukprot:ANDGO_01603.mRNA.1 hypothetical protein
MSCNSSTGHPDNRKLFQKGIFSIDIGSHASKVAYTDQKTRRILLVPLTDAFYETFPDSNSRFKACLLDHVRDDQHVMFLLHSMIGIKGEVVGKNQSSNSASGIPVDEHASATASSNGNGALSTTTAAPSWADLSMVDTISSTNVVVGEAALDGGCDVVFPDIKRLFHFRLTRSNFPLSETTRIDLPWLFVPDEENVALLRVKIGGQYYTLRSELLVALLLQKITKYIHRFVTDVLLDRKLKLPQTRYGCVATVPMEYSPAQRSAMMAAFEAVPALYLVRNKLYPETTACAADFLNPDATLGYPVAFTNSQTTDVESSSMEDGFYVVMDGGASSMQISMVQKAGPKLRVAAHQTVKAFACTAIDDAIATKALRLLEREFKLNLSPHVWDHPDHPSVVDLLRITHQRMIHDSVRRCKETLSLPTSTPDTRAPVKIVVPTLNTEGVIAPRKFEGAFRRKDLEQAVSVVFAPVNDTNSGADQSSSARSAKNEYQSFVKKPHGRSASSAVASSPDFVQVFQHLEEEAQGKAHDSGSSANPLQISTAKSASDAIRKVFFCGGSSLVHSVPSAVEAQVRAVFPELSATDFVCVNTSAHSVFAAAIGAVRMGIHALFGPLKQQKKNKGAAKTVPEACLQAVQKLPAFLWLRQGPSEYIQLATRSNDLPASIEVDMFPDDEDLAEVNSSRQWDVLIEIGASFADVSSIADNKARSTTVEPVANLHPFVTLSKKARRERPLVKLRLLADENGLLLARWKPIGCKPSESFGDTVGTDVVVAPQAPADGRFHNSRILDGMLDYARLLNIVEEDYVCKDAPLPAGFTLSKLREWCAVADDVDQAEVTLALVDEWKHGIFSLFPELKPEQKPSRPPPEKEDLGKNSPGSTQRQGNDPDSDNLSLTSDSKNDNSNKQHPQQPKASVPGAVHDDDGDDDGVEEITLSKNPHPNSHPNAVAV